MESQIQPDPQQGSQNLNIHDAKQRCFERIDDCATQKNPRFAAHAQGLEQMLQLWAKHSGVDARRGMSLDDRLKDHPDLKATVIGLLELIEQKISQALSSPADHGDAETTAAMMPTDDDDVDPEEFLIKQKWRSYNGNAWGTVGAAVDMLIELTAMIRKSTVRNSNLPTHFHRPDDYFAGYAKILARNWFKDARRSLTDQLGDSVFVRRRQMLYKMKHEEKISYTGTDPTAVPANSIPTLLTTREPTQGMKPLKPTTSRIKSLHPTPPIFANPSPSSTNLSQIDRNRLKQRNRKVWALSGITEGSVSIEETSFSYMYPEPPTLGEKQRYGLCPYCSVLLPASKLTKVAWRKHLHEDLQPYVCLSEKCQDPLQFFSNSEQWLQHMDKFHGKDWPQTLHMATWYCDRGHERVEFKSESELQNHLADHHESLSDAHVNALVRRNWGVGCREANVCPLCESTPSNIVPLMNDKDNASVLFRHLGDHLKALALFSLPSLNTGPASGGQKSSSGAQLPTNYDTKAHSSGNNLAVAQFDKDPDGSLTFDDDPRIPADTIGSEATMNKECLSDVPSELDAALEWKFAISEQEAPERDPVLKNLRIGYEQSQSASMPREQRKRVRLLDHIHHTLAFSVFDQKPRRFCPNGSIDTLITEKSVTSELWAKSSPQAHQLTEVEGLAEFISVSAKKLFAILILNGSHGQLLKRRMEFFREKNITDLSLPLQESWWDDNYWHGASRDRSRSIDESNYDSGGSCENEELWSLSRVERFCHAQQWFLVPIFSDTGLSYDFEADTILPFTEREHNVNHGGFERITRYRIHERHIDQQTTDYGRPYYVAVQEAYENILEKDPAWESQIQMLSRMNSLDHEHIVRFLAAFRRGQKGGHLIFEWASGGNLRNLWRTFHRPRLTSGLVKAAFRQMVGLTSAIHRAHYPPQSRPSRHGHLKPEKIFWFNDDNDTKIGTLKISGWEFGEGARRTIGLWVDEFERKHGTHGARRYEAPELATDIGPLQSQSCLCDIWSMGCIMLEFLIWLMYGVDGLNRFSQARQSSLFSQEVFFYQVKREGQDSTPVVTVDSVVLKWMDHMAADPACNVGSTALGNLLELIRTRLLVVKLPQEPEPVMSTASLQVSVGSDSSVAGQSCQGWERCKSSELEERMREIWDENETEKYWLAGDPKSPPVTKDRDLD